MLARPLAVLVVALVPAPAASAAKPANLHGFLLKSNESVSPHIFARTPSFAWSPFTGAVAVRVPALDEHERSLTTRSSGRTTDLKAPLDDGADHAPLDRRARAATAGSRACADSSPATSPPVERAYGFDMRPPGAPTASRVGTNPQPGMVRWTPIDGATAYEVVFPSSSARAKSRRSRPRRRQPTCASTTPSTTTRQSSHQGVVNIVYWRVRAVREPAGKPKNDLPVVSYGPWSSGERNVEPGITTSCDRPPGRDLAEPRDVDRQRRRRRPGAPRARAGLLVERRRQPHRRARQLPVFPASPARSSTSTSTRTTTASTAFTSPTSSAAPPTSRDSPACSTFPPTRRSSATPQGSTSRTRTAPRTRAKSSTSAAGQDLCSRYRPAPAERSELACPRAGRPASLRALGHGLAVEPLLVDRRRRRSPRRHRRQQGRVPRRQLRGGQLPIRRADGVRQDERGRGRQANGVPYVSGLTPAGTVRPASEFHPHLLRSGRSRRGSRLPGRRSTRSSGAGRRIRGTAPARRSRRARRRS